MNNNGNAQMPPQPQQAPQIVITLLPNGQVHGSGPTDMQLLFMMLGEFLKQIGANLEFKPPSPIIQPPPGLVIKGE